MVRYCFLGVLCLILAGCKKGDEFFLTKGTFETEDRTTVGAPVMYTYQKQITDRKIIDAFIVKHTSSEYFSSESSIPTPHSALKLFLSGDGKAQFLTKGSKDTILAEVVEKTSSKLIIAHVDSVSALGSLPSEKSHYQILSESMIDRPPVRVIEIPSVFGYSAVYRYRPTFRFNIKNGRLVIPLLSRIVRSGLLYSKQSGTWGYEWNVFNDKVIQYLQPGDTIVYQPMEVKMRKVN